MLIAPEEIERSGPGVDLNSLPGGLSIRMSDPVRDLKYALNRVTLTFELSPFEHVRLAFEAKEFGEEPHVPPPAPFADDAVFDGVPVSADGMAWYEVQDLRALRADRLTAYDLDLDAAAAQWGLAYGSGFLIRFCQYDNNPAPMDGVFLRGIRLTGDTRPTSTDHLMGNYADASDCLFWYAYEGSITGRVVRSNATVRCTRTGGDDGVWHHYALVRRGTTLRFWRDGHLDKSRTAAANAADLAAAALRIGRSPSGGGPAAGCVDDFRVYDRALLDWEIAALAAGGW